MGFDAERKAKDLALWMLRRASTLERRFAIRSYLRTPAPHRLLLGGTHTHAGWLSTDLRPRRGILYMDPTKPWPIPDGSLDAIVCDHVIEHISHPGANVLVGEAHRVLRPNGVLRVSTPDMEVVGALLRGEATGYAVWSNEKYGQLAEGSNPVFTVNRLLREWGHTFIYDEPTLAAMFLRAGFALVKRESLGTSEHEFLQNADFHAEEVGVEPYAFESMIFDATK